MSVTEKTLCLSFEIRMPHSSLAQPGISAVGWQTPSAPLTRDWGGRRRTPARPGRDRGHARKIRFGVPAFDPPCGWRQQHENLERDVLRLDLPANTVPIWQVAGQPFSEAQAIRHGPHADAAWKAAWRG